MFGQERIKLSPKEEKNKKIDDSIIVVDNDLKSSPEDPNNIEGEILSQDENYEKEFKEYYDNYTYTEEETQFAKKTGNYLAVVMYDFEGDKSLHQLDLVRLDFLWVTSSHPEEDWWFGKLKSGEEGYFLKTYIVVLKRKVSVSTSKSQKIQEIQENINLS